MHQKVIEQTVGVLSEPIFILRQQFFFFLDLIILIPRKEIWLHSFSFFAGFVSLMKINRLRG